MTTLWSAPLWNSARHFSNRSLTGCIPSRFIWVVMIDGSYAKTGLLHALAQLPKQPRSSLRDLHALFSGSKERTLIV